MEPDDAQNRRRRTLIALQIVRFAVAAVMLVLAFYFRDVLLGVLAIAFLAIGTFTTWLRLRQEQSDE